MPASRRKSSPSSEGHHTDLPLGTLLALAIRSRNMKETLPRTERLLAQIPQPSMLYELGPAELEGLGLTSSESVRLVAALEFERRLTREAIIRKPCERPGAVARHVVRSYLDTSQEVMGVLYLDLRSRVIAEEECFRGTIRRMAMEPRPILKRALLIGAPAVVLFHTHPSGDPTPSREDFQATERFLRAGEIVGVRLVDHLIVGTDANWVSLREQGYIEHGGGS